MRLLNAYKCNWVVWKYYPNELVKTLGRGSLMYEMTDACHEFLEGNLGEQGFGL